MSLATAPGATDICICSHAGAMHDATSQVCRFQKQGGAGSAQACGCVSFGYPGAMTNRSPAVGNTPATTGPSQQVPLPAGANNDF